MDQEALVEPQISSGRALVDALDKSGLNPSAAFWFYYSDTQQWRLLICGPKLDPQKNPERAYAAVGKALLSLGDAAQSLSISDIKVVSVTDPLVKALLAILKTPSNAIAAATFKNNFINGVLIEDAYVYRSS